MSTEAKVGAFTVLGLALLAAVLVLLSGISFGSKGYTLYAGFHQVLGVEKQSAVRLSGVPVGKVRNITNDGSGVTVKMAINKGIKIPRGSRVTVDSVGVMGEKFINILPGDETQGFLDNGDYLIGDEEQGLTQVFAQVSDTLAQVQELMKSMNSVLGNDEFKGAIIQMAVNMRDATAHISGLMSQFEQMAANNQGNVTQMMSNLNAMTASLERSANSVEAIMANLQTVGADPQTAENLRQTVQNIADTSARVERMAENIEKVAGDPQVAEDAKVTIANARKLTDRAGGMMGKLNKLSSIKATPQVDVLYSGSEHDWSTNFNVNIGSGKGLFLDAGVDDIGDEDLANVQVGRRRGGMGYRGGVVAGEAGIGLDAYAGDKFKFSADAYDPDDLTLRLRAQYAVGSDGTWLMGQWNDVNDKDKRAFYAGIRQEF